MSRRPGHTEDTRQRTAQACEPCKKRKQKCTGAKPCETCVKRHTTCTYRPKEPLETDDSSPPRPPPQRRRTKQATTLYHHHGLPTNPANGSQEDHLTNELGLSVPITFPGGDKEAEAYDQSRMLEDHNGRPSYLGDSATMSCLQLIRIVVERATGPCLFTYDPNRQKIAEADLTIPETVRTALTLPDKKAAEALMESFFINTHGLIDIFDRRSFLQKLGAWYSSPLSVRSSDLCLIYLVLSIGLVMATPAESSPEHHIVTQLRSQEVDHAEVFFRSAKALGDSVCRFEDGEFWTVQALCLMSVYTLAVSKQNAAYVHLGQAVRSAYALGLHKVRETALIFKNEHLQQRRNLWRSLYVLDRFLAMSLGRPTAISEDDCPDDSLEAPTRPSGKTKTRRDQIIGSNGLNANVQASRIISEILKKVYLKPKISTELAQDIADDYKRWSSDLHHAFHSNNLFKSDIAPAQAMAVLHTQLLGCHSIILLTRPIFMYLLVRAQKSRLENQAPVLDPTSRMEMFSETCIIASTKTIRLAQAVFDSKRLPRSNPFILYFVFTAALLIMANEFGCLHDNPCYQESITYALNIVSYCSATDVEAGRFIFILTAFKDVLQGQAALGGPAQHSHRVYPARSSPGSSKDPIEILPCRDKIPKREESASRSPRPAPRESEADISHVSQAPMNPQGRRRPKMSSTGAAESTFSPVNSLPLLPQACRTSEREESNPGGSGSLHSEPGFHFDGFWEESVSHVHTPGTGPGPMAQIHATETGDAMEYIPYATSGVSSTPQNQSTGTVRDPTGVTYPPDDHTKYER